MINVIELRKLAEQEYDSGNKELVSLENTLVNEINELSSSLNSTENTEEILKIKCDLEEVKALLQECQVMKIIAINEKAVSILIDSTLYNDVLFQKGALLGNINFNNAEMFSSIQNSDILLKMWKKLFQETDFNIVECLEVFATSVDVVVDFISDNPENGLNNLIQFNDKVEEYDMSLSKILHEKVQSNGKDSTIELLKAFTEEDKIPLEYRAILFQEIDDYSQVQQRYIDLQENVLDFVNEPKVLNKKQGN